MATPDHDDLPSLGLVLAMLRAGREERRSHFDALDQKAGLAVGFAGLLVTMSINVAEPWRTLGVIAAVIATALALSSFWPRRYEVLDYLRDYASAPLAHTQLVLVDTLAAMNIRTDQSMGAKARRLKAALLTLALSVVMLSVGITGTHPGDNDGATRSGGGLSAPTVSPAPTAGP